MPPFIMNYPRIYKFQTTGGSGTYTSTNTGATLTKPIREMWTAVFQAIGVMSAGTGSAVISIQGSCDDTNWITLGTISLTLSTTATSDGFAISAPWPYMRANVTTLTANGSVTVYMGL